MKKKKEKDFEVAPLSYSKTRLSPKDATVAYILADVLKVPLGRYYIVRTANLPKVIQELISDVLGRIKFEIDE